MVTKFDNQFAAELVGLWEFGAGAETADTGLGDGIAQNGSVHGKPVFASGWMLTNADGHMAVEDGNDHAFDLNEGTIATTFVQSDNSGAAPQTVLSRGVDRSDGSGDRSAASDAQGNNGHFGVRVTPDGAVEVLHCFGGITAVLNTSTGFVSTGDTISVTYSWSTDHGVKLLVENQSQGTSETHSDPEAGVSMSLTDDSDKSFVFGARDLGAAEYDQPFNGSLGYVAVLDAPVLINGGDGIVDGTAAGDVIDLAYTGDPEGDVIDGGDAIIAGHGPDDDVVDAVAGDDLVQSAEGDDTVYAGSGDDTVFGGSGDDLLLGDSAAPDSDIQGTAREVFQWDLAPDPDDGGAIDDADSLDGSFVQNTGSVSVTYWVLQQSEGVQTTFTDVDQLVEDIAGPGDTADDSSGLGSLLRDASNTAAYKLSFSAAVTNMTFRVNDIDGDGQVRITAYDTQGQQVDVQISGGSNLSLVDGDMVPGPETATGDGNYGDPDSTEYSLLVTIPGPVSLLRIGHAQDGPNTSGVTVTDIYFDVPVVDDGDAGNDLLVGDVGDDTLIGEGGDDTLVGGSGSDSLLGGDDRDVMGAGPGDTVQGGEGGDDFDTLIAPGLAVVDFDGTDPTGESGTVTHYDSDLSVTGTTDFSEIENVLIIGSPTSADPASGHDGGPGSTSLDGIVEGTPGDDVIDLDYTGDPENDRVDNDDAVPPLVDEQDVILAGAGNDSVRGEQDSDIIFGGTGDDTLLGNAGNDGLDGGDGDDVLDGGAGRDIVVGGRGDDLISGSNDDAADGGDILAGQTGNDTFVNVGEGEVIYGGEDADGNDIDTLDLTGAAEAANPGGRLVVELSDTDPEDGVVRFFDSDGVETGITEFYDIERIVPCFTPGTLVATPKGERRVETLAVGDRVITRDNGIQEIQWVGTCALSQADLARDTHFQPVFIRRGALGNGLPERDMLVSPNHRVLVANDKTSLYFEEREVLVAAKHLTGLEGVDIVSPESVNYIHFMFPQHEIVLTDGAWTESFQPGDLSLNGVGNAQRNEIYELFPELKTSEGLESYTAARRSLKRHEARLLSIPGGKQ